MKKILSILGAVAAVLICIAILSANLFVGIAIIILAFYFIGKAKTADKSQEQTQPQESQQQHVYSRRSNMDDEYNEIIGETEQIRINTIKGRARCNDFIAFDIETTGLSPSNCEIIEFAAVRFINGKEFASFEKLIKPKVPITEFITKINGITNDMVADSPSIEEMLPKLTEFIGELPIVMHNATFDLSFLMANLHRQGVSILNPYVCTLNCSRKYVNLNSHKLINVAKHFNIDQGGYHRAYADARITGMIFIELLKLAEADQEAKRIERRTRA